MSILNDDQARLLDAYCDALARDPGAVPPAGLDPDFAAVARHLAAHTAPEPEAGTLEGIRARLFAPPVPDTMNDGAQAATWAASPMAMRMPSPPPAASLRERAAAPRPMMMRAAPPPPAAPPPADQPALAAAPPPAAPPPVAPPPAAAMPHVDHAAPSDAPDQRPAVPARLAWILIGTLIAAVAIGLLILFLLL